MNSEKSLNSIAISVLAGIAIGIAISFILIRQLGLGFLWSCLICFLLLSVGGLSGAKFALWKLTAPKGAVIVDILVPLSCLLSGVATAYVLGHIFADWMRSINESFGNYVAGLIGLPFFTAIVCHQSSFIKKSEYKVRIWTISLLVSLIATICFLQQLVELYTWINHKVGNVANGYFFAFLLGFIAAGCAWLYSTNAMTDKNSDP